MTLFISYRHENGFLMAQVIRDRLKERGISCFMDMEEDKSGNFNEALLSAIENAPNFILILPKNALTRCKNPEDWVRREVVAAVKAGKNLIPVMYEDFQWPRTWHPDIPEEVRMLKDYQGVAMSKEYLSAMIDKIIQYMKNLPDSVVKRHNEPASTGPSLDSVDFFSTITSNPQGVDNVCMAFHAGADWRQDSRKLQLLNTILKNRIQMRVILNDAETADNICRHMQQPLKKYVGFDACVSNWMELQELYPECIQVRVSKLPMLHRIYLLRNKDGSGQVSLKYYTYGNYKPSRDFRAAFSSGTMEYTLYCEEFDYLWNLAGK